MKKTIPLLFWCLLCLFVFMKFNPFSILGPMDQPDIKVTPWSSLELIYWIKVTDTMTENRAIVIREPSTLKDLQTRLNIKEISGMSVATGGQFILKIQDGRIWDGNVVFENRIGLCKASDNYYSYCFDLKDDKFYLKLKELCLRNERKTVPKATKRHIILRKNQSLNSYGILPNKKNKN